MSEDSRVSDALGRIADDAPAGDSIWDTTQRRIARRRRRRAVVASIAAVVVVALGAATVVALTRGDDDGPNVAVQPSPPSRPDQALAVVDGRLVVKSTADGSSRDMPTIEGAQSVEEVSSVPGSHWIAYTVTRPPSPGCGDTPSLVLARSDGSSPAVINGGTIKSPLMSPDGRSVAYEMGECQPVGDVAVTTLEPTMDNYRFAVPGERPLAWTLDSKQLLVVQGEGEYQLARLPQGKERKSPPLPAGAHAAAFVSDQEVALAITQPDVGDEIAAYDISTGAKRTLMTVKNYVVTTMSYDPASGVLLVVATDGNGNGSMSLVRQGNAETTIVHGLTGAAWFDPPESALRTTSSTVPTDHPSTTTVVPPTPTTVALSSIGTLPPPVEFAGATDWSAVDSATEHVFFASAPSPQAKVDALVAWYLGEGKQIEGRRDAFGVVTQVDGNRAQVEVRVIGFADDSVGGAEYRVHLAQQSAGGEWRVTAVESRNLCLRSVDEASNLCV